MGKPRQKTLVLAVGVVVAIMFIASCEEEQNLTDTKLATKKSRLVAVENMQLKKQIEQQERMHANAMKKQKELLNKCLQDKKALEEVSAQTVRNLMDDVLANIIEENAKLQKENEALKAQIEQLEKEFEELKKRVPSEAI